MPSLLIAGSGYVGKAIQSLALASHGIFALTKSGSEGTIACDLSSPEAVQHLADNINEPITHIVHCASSGRGGADAYRAVFLEGTGHLLKSFPDAKLLFVSSTSVYGQIDGSIVTEESATSPDRETSRILLEAEQTVLRAGGCVTRLAGIYGPGRSVILKKLLTGTAVIEEDGRRFLNQIHRDDAASAIVHLLQNTPFPSGEIFNISDSHPMSQLECYQKLSAQFSLPLPPSGPKPENRKRAWTHKKVSNEKILTTDWKPNFPSFLDASETIAPTLAL